MTDIEQRARAVLNEAKSADYSSTICPFYAVKVVMREIEAHDVTKAEVSNRCRRLIRYLENNDLHAEASAARDFFHGFILPEPVDPLVEIMRSAGVGQGVREEVMTELAKRGITITKGNPDEAQ